MVASVHGDVGSHPVVRRAAVLVYPGCAVAEVLELSTRLSDAGIDVTYVGGAGVGPFADRSGLLVQADVAVAQLVPESVDLVIVPGGDPEVVLDDQEVSSFLASAEGSGAVLAGICAGVLVLAANRLLKGRSITHNYRSPWAPSEVTDFVERFWDGARVEPDLSVGVVVDGAVITALPNATIEFAMTVCREVGVYTSTHSRLVGRHLRGEYVAELYVDDVGNDDVEGKGCRRQGR